jgi:ribosomal protein S18 acetylase RimI-like enzyme
MTAVLKVVEPGAVEIATISANLASAFADDPFFAFVLPDPRDRVARLTGFMETQVRFGYLFAELMATPDSNGAAVWYPPDVEITHERASAAGFLGLGEILGRDALSRFGVVMDRLQHVFTGEMSEPHWFLNLVGVVPARRRLGLGAALVRSGFTHADEQGFACYLCTFEPKNLAFYRALGFTIGTAGVDEPSGLRFWTMIREPDRS